MLKFTFRWQMRQEERLFDKKTRCGFWIMELNPEWNIKYFCEQNKKQNLVLMEIHRKSFSGERIVSGTLEIDEEHQCLLKKNFVCLLEDNCFFTSIDLKCSNNAIILPPRLLLVNGEINISAYMEDSVDLTELVHVTNTDYLSLKQLSDDMEKLLLDKSFPADVSLKCGDISVPAHRNILCARSAVFKALFSCPMEGTMEKEVVLEDIDAKIIQEVVKYMHTGKMEDLEISRDKPLHILKVAIIYQISSLEYIICRLFLQFMSKEDIIFLPPNLSSPDLKNYAINFLCNRITDFSALEKVKNWVNWKNNNPFLALEILSAVVKFQEQKLKMRV